MVANTQIKEYYNKFSCSFLVSKRSKYLKKDAELFARCSLLFTFCLFLVTFSSFIVNFCLLSKISSSCFCVWYKTREFEGRGSLRFPCVTPVLKSFSSDLLRAMISYWEESHLKSCQASTVELSCKNNQRFQHVDYFRKKAPPYIFDRTPNVSPSEVVANMGCGWTASVWNL